MKLKLTSKTKRAIEYFNRHIDADIVAILDASSVLEVTEFQFFELAYRDWHGRKASERQIEKYFAAYMFAERVPSWVRSFARKILRSHAKGRLDPKTYGIWQRLPSARMRFFAKAYVAALIVTFIAITMSVYSLPEEVLAVFRQCYFPPCY